MSQNSKISLLLLFLVASGCAAPGTMKSIHYESGKRVEATYIGMFVSEKESLPGEISIRLGARMFGYSNDMMTKGEINLFAQNKSAKPYEITVKQIKVDNMQYDIAAAVHVAPNQISYQSEGFPVMLRTYDTAFPVTLIYEKDGSLHKQDFQMKRLTVQEYDAMGKN